MLNPKVSISIGLLHQSAAGKGKLLAQVRDDEGGIRGRALCQSFVKFCIKSKITFGSNINQTESKILPHLTGIRRQDADGVGPMHDVQKLLRRLAHSCKATQESKPMKA